LSLDVDKEVGAANPPQPESGSILPLEPPKADQTNPMWLFGLAAVFLAVLLIFSMYRLFRTKKPYKEAKTAPSNGRRRAALHIKHGPHAGKSYALNKLPVLIGRDPQNDICINDPHVISRHAQIFSERNGYYLRDLGGNTSINGHSVKNNVVSLNPGDVVRLGRSVLFVFG
ncbi:MAG: FHA domain-containing protein, partial [Anaerolineales bacterium]|nr:FHA domain-containing protein [Anaerolineales bacterium]